MVRKVKGSTCKTTSYLQHHNLLSRNVMSLLPQTLSNKQNQTQIYLATNYKTNKYKI